MMHFFRRSKIHLDCFTDKKQVVECAPIVSASKVLPEWWKRLPNEYVRPGNFFPTGTMKGCTGVIDYYKNSVALPLWSELAIEVDAAGGCRWQFSDHETVVKPHDTDQYSGFVNNRDCRHLKLVSPWVFQTKEDVNWLVTQPIYNEPNFFDYTTAMGVLNFYRQTSTNIQLFVNTKTPRVLNIQFGTPFLFTPMSDKKVVIHRHLVTQEELLSKEKIGAISFINVYKKNMRIEKCPFRNHVETK